MIVRNAVWYVMCMCTSLTQSLVSPRIVLDIVCSNISYVYGYNEETLKFNLSKPFKIYCQLTINTNKFLGEISWFIRDKL